MKHKKVTYQGLGHKLGFGSYSLITYYSDDDITIVKISKKAYNELLNNGYAEEA